MTHQFIEVTPTDQQIKISINLAHIISFHAADESGTMITLNERTDDSSHLWVHAKESYEAIKAAIFAIAMIRTV